MKVKIFDSRDECLQAGADMWVKFAKAEKKMIIGCCTGTTTEPIHQIVIDMYKKDPWDTTGQMTCNADEHWTPPGANMVLEMRPRMQPLFDTLGMDEEHAMMPNAQCEDPYAEAERYEKAIRDKGGVGLQMLGVGPDAHLGFCLPGTPFESLTHVVDESQSVGMGHYRRGLDFEFGPVKGITMGLRTFMMGQYTLPIVSGSHKAEATANAILGPVTERVPASILQLHPNCTWYCDKDAAEGIIGRIDENGIRIK
ncbi:6-phosphogluconolactonase [Eubacteriales bacterium OttesenSCG-928-M02]|nr:6-phosphogluconolactonase [Eubacteriales bacterium OttesenSCG-928-M02]